MVTGALRSSCIRGLAAFRLCILLGIFGSAALGGEKPAFEDFGERLEQEIQGRMHGLMAGNLPY